MKKGTRPVESLSIEELGAILVEAREKGNALFFSPREKAARDEIQKRVDLTTPRCGTCYSPCDPQHSDEGYSYCCNDRIEYPDEYASNPWFLHQFMGFPEPTDETLDAFYGNY